MRATSKTILLIVAVTIGCDRSSLHTLPVVGTITYRGQPLGGGSVSFHPVDAMQSRPGTARINSDGRFIAATLQNTEGLVPGEYKVSVFYTERPLFDASPAKSTSVKMEIPSRYCSPETSGLTLNVPAGGNGVTYSIELTD